MTLVIVITLVVVAVVALAMNEVVLNAMVDATEEVAGISVFSEEEIAAIWEEAEWGIAKAFGMARTYHQYAVDVEMPKDIPCLSETEVPVFIEDMDWIICDIN